MPFIKKSSQLFANRNINFIRLFEDAFRQISNNNPGKKFEEIKIPVPWGNIVGKWWGPMDQRPIVCIHGWQDNYNSFDELIKLLPDRSYLAIDYPGHGKSSQMPRGTLYYPSDVPVILRRIHKYFGWPKISILAHSLGANLSCLYTAIFPDDVDLFIALDGFKPFSKQPGEFIEKMGENIDVFLQYDAINNSGTEPPAYTKDDIAKIMHEASLTSIDIDKCKILYERNIAESKTQPGKYYFTRDIRVKTGSIICWQHDDLKEYLKRIKCPMLMIRTLGSKFIEKQKYLDDAVRIMTEYNTKFHFVEVQGKHHAHLNNAKMVVGFITEFLKKYDHGDRYLEENSSMYM